MKYITVITAIILLIGIKTGFGSDLDNILGGMLNAVSEPKTYTFSAGEKILSQMGENLYYSGYEYSDEMKVLLLTYVENNVPIILKFPNPDIIKVKDATLKIIDFNNQYLQLRDSSRYQLQ
ncbi:MAG: hypothetical protein P9M06_00190 [Candidatus Saelkia tenebricola]|nr:hypothetical protein [Candidatus Saelkia tenebricola]